MILLLIHYKNIPNLLMLNVKMLVKRKHKKNRTKMAFEEFHLFLLECFCALVVQILREGRGTCTYKALLNSTCWPMKGEMVSLNDLKEWFGIPVAEGHCF